MFSSRVRLCIPSSSGFGESENFSVPLSSIQFMAVLWNCVEYYYMNVQ